MYVDSHAHLAEPRVQARLPELLRRSVAGGVTRWVQGGIGPEDWELQRELARLHPGMKLVFGLHPYWVASHSETECENALDLLSRDLAPAVAVGEMGLDFREPYLAQRELQIDMFRAQLELAHVAGKPAVLHLVRAHEESLRVLDLVGVPRAGGMVHSFNSTFDVASAYLERGLLLSVGGPLLRQRHQRLKEAVTKIPLESLLLESDTPDQGPGPATESEPLMILEVASEVGRLKGIPQQEILETCARNAAQFFKL